ncbi:MAG: hypothetical protein A3I75_06465 [Deltaproteobacteria bacterium RIFCSPLOWO2_02_FULL_50_16]|nr:MAG: hypothetical protein A3I75_06465 [Deltaproteobacteria bacterium RIFCSPLOWO2_02_FULL_50_16]
MTFQPLFLCINHKAGVAPVLINKLRKGAKAAHRISDASGSQASGLRLKKNWSSPCLIRTFSGTTCFDRWDL